MRILKRTKRVSSAKRSTGFVRFPCHSSRMTDFAGLLIAVGKDKIKFLSIVVSGSEGVRKSYGAASLPASVARVKASGQSSIASRL